MSVLPSDLVVYGALGTPSYDGAGTLSASATAAQVNFTLNTTVGSGFPPSGGMPVEFPVLLGSEIIWITQGTSGTATVALTGIRGFAGTAAASAVSGASITMLAGGPVDMLSRISFTDIVAGDVADIVSSSAADVSASISLTGRNPGGTIVNNITATLSGTTPVTGIGGAQTWDRFLYLTLGRWTTLSAAVTGTANTTIAVNLATAATGGFNIVLGKEVMGVSSGGATTTWTVTRNQRGSTATLHNNGDNVYILPSGDVAVYDHTAAVTGTFTATGSGSTGTTPQLLALTAGQTGQATIGTIIRVTSGNSNNQIRYVIANTGYGTNTVAVNRDFATQPGSGDTYSVLNGFVLESLTGSGTGNTVANQISTVQRVFWNDAADVPGGQNRNYYQKAFEVNNNTVTDFTAASVQIFSETGALPTGASLNLALTTGAADTLFVSQRQTAPATGSITAYATGTGNPVSVLANSGGLLHGAAPNSAAAQGMWFNLALVSGTAAYKGAADVRVIGTTT